MPYLTPQEQKVLIVVVALLLTGFIVKQWRASTEPAAGFMPVEQK
tara:strand:- start:243 stop:377 length:135 start_codon:yes stop_codon:yes gene_type:complete